jgi:hypothetical protein
MFYISLLALPMVTMNGFNCFTRRKLGFTTVVIYIIITIIIIILTAVVTIVIKYLIYDFI